MCNINNNIDIEIKNNNNICSIDDESNYLSLLSMNKNLLNKWNNKWIKESLLNEHYHTKKLIPNINFAKELFHKILVTLKHNELKIITRLLSGNVKLNYYMNKINYSNYKYCAYCTDISSINNINKQQQQQKYEETIEHFLLYCTAFKIQRTLLNKKIKKEINCKLSLQLLLTGYPCKNIIKRNRIIRYTIQFINDCDRLSNI